MDYSITKLFFLYKILFNFEYFYSTKFKKNFLIPLKLAKNLDIIKAVFILFPSNFKFKS